MKRYLLVFSFCLLLLPFTGQAQTPDELMARGNEAFKSGDFNGAVEAYSAVLDAGYESADLYYNIGNAYYRMDEYGQAILNYERALRLRPNFRDARQNVELAQSKTEDQITPLPEVFLIHWAHALVNLFSPTGWRIALLVVAALLALLVVVFLLSSDYGWRKGTLAGSVVTVVVLLICIACAIASSVRYNRHDEAVVTLPMTVVKSSPEEGSVDKMVLHEGTKITIDETLGNWHKIHIADGNTGWVEETDITII